MKKTIIAALLAAAFAVPALAEDYATLEAKLDDAMATVQVDETTKGKVEGFKADAEAKSKAGDAAGSMQALKDALALLGVK